MPVDVDVGDPGPATLSTMEISVTSRSQIRMPGGTWVKRDTGTGRFLGREANGDAPPWNGQAQHEGAVRRGRSASVRPGQVVYVIAEERQAVHLLRVQGWG